MILEDYLKLPYKFELVPDPIDGGYVISYPELVGCLSQGDTIEEALAMGEDAKKAWISTALEIGKEIPLPTTYNKFKEYSGEFKLRMSEELHRDLANTAKKQGVSLNQYCLYLLSKNNALQNA